MTDCSCTNFPASLGNVTFGASVGIGTTTPEWQLHVRQDAPNVLALVDTATAAESSQLALGEAGTLIWQIYKPANSHDLRFFRSNRGDQMTIQDATGNVGIGTTSPQQALDVNGTVRSTGILLGGDQLMSGSLKDSTGTRTNVDAGGCYYAS